MKLKKKRSNQTLIQIYIFFLFKDNFDLNFACQGQGRVRQKFPWNEVLIYPLAVLSLIISLRLLKESQLLVPNFVSRGWIFLVLFSLSCTTSIFKSVLNVSSEFWRTAKWGYIKSRLFDMLFVSKTVAIEEINMGKFIA